MEKDKKNLSRKLKRVEVNTPEGKKYLTYKPIFLDENSEDLVCSRCSYLGKCDKIINPETPEDPESTFQEFCSELGVPKSNLDTNVDSDILSYIPQSGTIEENLYEVEDIYQKLIKKNGYVRLSDVIDGICKNTCPFYNENHSQCKTMINMCILEDVIKKQV